MFPPADTVRVPAGWLVIVVPAALLIFPLFHMVVEITSPFPSASSHCPGVATLKVSGVLLNVALAGT